MGATAVMIESWLPRLEICAAMTIAFAILSHRRVTSDTQFGEVFLVPPLVATIFIRGRSVMTRPN